MNICRASQQCSARVAVTYAWIAGRGCHLRSARVAVTYAVLGWLSLTSLTPPDRCTAVTYVTCARPASRFRGQQTLDLSKVISGCICLVASSRVRAQAGRQLWRAEVYKNNTRDHRAVALARERLVVGDLDGARDAKALASREYDEASQSKV